MPRFQIASFPLEVVRAAVCKSLEVGEGQNAGDDTHEDPEEHSEDEMFSELFLSFIVSSEFVVKVGELLLHSTRKAYHMPPLSCLSCLSCWIT